MFQVNGDATSTGSRFLKNENAFIRILPGDRVLLQLSLDLTRGRITYDTNIINFGFSSDKGFSVFSRMSAIMKEDRHKDNFVSIAG